MCLIKQYLLAGLLAVGVVGVGQAQQQAPHPAALLPEVMGNWVNCRTEIGASAVLANVCRRLVFRLDGTGQAHLDTLGRPDTLGTFTWQRTADQLTLRYAHAGEPVLAAGRYSISQRGERVLVLTDARGARYVLTQ